MVEYCSSCGSRNLSSFYKVKRVPVHSCVLLSTKSEAINFPRSDIDLAFCNKCGLISNLAFDPNALDYSAVYEDQQCFSSTFNTFAKNLAQRLIQKYNLYNKDILEIGCGKGDFLALICEIGNNRGIGIDPAFIKNRVNSKKSKKLTFIKDYYSKHYAKYHGNLVCCRHTLEHIHNTNEFLNNIRYSMRNHLDTIVFFEVPDVTRVLHECAFWDIYYEHCSYFSLGSLSRLFRSCKFEITTLMKDFHDQYLLLEAKPVKEESKKTHELEESVEELKKLTTFFSMRYKEKIKHWKALLTQSNQDLKRVIIWGSGSKCVSFLSTLKIQNEIEYVVDINPHRHGKFLPSLSQKIMPPEFLKKYNPDITIVMNPIYLHEIRQMLIEMNVNTKVISV